MKLTQEVPVSCEENTIFRFGKPHERYIVKRRVIACVVPEHAQPAGEAPKHGVREEAW